LCSQYLTDEALEGFGHFKTEGQVICTVKWADVVLMGKEDEVLQGVTGRPTETGRCCGMEMNVGKTKDVRISRQSSPIQIVIDQKQQKCVEYFNCLGSMMTNDARRTCEILDRFSKKYCHQM
jgi:hypothetical protein